MNGRSERTWDDLVTVATLGTDRRPVDLGGWSGRPGELARALPSAGPALLLDAAALATAYRRAGSSPLVAGARPAPPAPAPVRPEVPAAAATRVRELLAAGEHHLVREWLLLTAAAGCRAPVDCLPQLLDLAAGPQQLGGEVAAVLDLPGAWLAGFRPAWTRAVAAATPLDGPPPDAWWTHGTPEQRVAWLLAAREADPVAGRHALEQVWAREKADDRLALLAASARDLGPDDEPFLERALDDRSAQVRSHAAALLARLPGSAFARRWSERLAAQVVVQRSALRGRRLVVDPGAALDDSTRRDLGGASPSGHPLALLVGAPAHAWRTVLGEPASFVPLPVAGAERARVHEVWAHAARRDRDVALARALLDEGAGGVGLLEILPAAERSARAALLVGAGHDPARAVEVLSSCAAPWGPDLVGATVRLLAPAERDPAAAARGRRLLDLLAARADARDRSAVDRLRRVVDLLPVTSPLQAAAHRALQKLSVRVMLHAEVLGTSGTTPDPSRPGDGSSPGGDR